MYISISNSQALSCSQAGLITSRRFLVCQGHIERSSEDNRRRQKHVEEKRYIESSEHSVEEKMAHTRQGYLIHRHLEIG